MDLTSEAAATQNQNQNKSIQGCEDEGGNEKKGDFLMLVTEILNALIRNDFDAAEIKIILFIAKKTIGQKCKFRSFSVGSIATETQIVERHVKRVLQKLVQKTALIKVKRKGERHPQYGLSIEYFGRTNVGQIENVYYLDKEFENTKVTLRALSKGPVEHFQRDIKVTFKKTKKPPKQAPVVPHKSYPQNPSYVLSNVYSYLSQSMTNFLNSVSPNTKERWTNLVGGIVTQNAEDEAVLLFAIEEVQRTGKDFLGNPIRTSSLSLFESTDWRDIKLVILGKIKREKEEADKVRRSEENKALVAETRRRMQVEAEDRMGNVYRLP